MCVYCEKPERVGEVVYEDAGAMVLIHSDWTVRGHPMVVSQQHIDNASDLGDEDWQHLARVWHRVERLLLELAGAVRAVIFKLGILTPHLHIHIYPIEADASRDEVFAAPDGKTRAPR